MVMSAGTFVAWLRSWFWIPVVLPSESSNCFARQPPPGSAPFLRATYFPHRVGLFMVVVDAKQLLMYAGQEFMCLAYNVMHAFWNAK